METSIRAIFFFQAAGRLSSTGLAPRVGMLSLMLREHLCSLNLRIFLPTVHGTAICSWLLPGACYIALIYGAIYNFVPVP